MGGFLAELRRRHIFRIGAVYVVVAWGIIQVLDVLSQLFALSDWIAQPAVVVLAIGFPVTLVAAWMIVGAADGGEAARGLKATATDWVLASALITVLAFMGYQKFSPSTVEVVDTVEIDQDTEDRLPNSIAVLPFENLSLDPENAFFATGIHGTLLNELAKISDMNVISRTSVLRYTDGLTPIPQIAEELNVETVMEGTVQYADGQVRITAQLIDPKTGAHLWSENYDRDFSGIFGIQSEIASNIAMALEAELLPDERESIEQPLTNSPEAYAGYLKAIAVIEPGFEVAASPGTGSVIQNYLEEALQLDPEFALAHAWKARVYIESRQFDPVTEEEWLDFKSEMERLANMHADRALALDPGVGLAHSARALVHLSNWRSGPALMEAEQALRLSPNDPDVLIQYSEILLFTRNQTEDGISYLQRAAEIDPQSSSVLWSLGLSLLAANRYTEAAEILRECLALNPRAADCSMFLARVEFALGNHDAALDAVRLSEQILLVDVYPVIWADVAYGYGLLGQGEDARRVFERITELAADRYVTPLAWAYAYMGVGDYDEALSRLNEVIEICELNQSTTPFFRQVEQLVGPNTRGGRMDRRPRKLSL